MWIRLVFFLSYSALSMFDVAAQVFSLEDAYKYAVENNKKFKSDALNINKARYQLLETTAIGLPQLNGSFGYMYFLDRPVQLIPGDFMGLPSDQMAEVRFGTDHQATVELQASQLLIDFRYITGVMASREYMNMSLGEFEKSKIELKSSVATNYYAVLVSKEHELMMKKSLENMFSLKENSQAMLNEGFTDLLEFRQIELTYNSLEDAYNQSKRSSEARLDLLKLSMGYPLSKSLKLSMSFKDAVDLMLSTEVSMDSFKHENHADFAVVSSNERLMKLNAWAERTKLLPNMQVYYSLQQMAMRNDYNLFDQSKPWYRSQILGLRLNVPIFSSGQRIAQIGKANIAHEQAKQMMQLTEQQLNFNARQAKNNLKSSLEHYLNAKDNMILSQEIFEKTMVKYHEGVAGSFELNNAKTQALNMQIEYVNAAMALCNAKLESLKSNGEL